MNGGDQREVSKSASYYRQPKRNHLLFRPVGQLAFARAVEYLLSTDMNLDAAIKLLHSKNKMNLADKVWHHVLWDPVAEKMLNNWSPAEAQLLISAGREPRTPQSANRLTQLQRTTTGS